MQKYAKLEFIYQCLMFDFEKLVVSAKAKNFNSGVRKYLTEYKLDHCTNDQLRRASFSIVLNTAEGSFTHVTNRCPVRYRRTGLFCQSLFGACSA